MFAIPTELDADKTPQGILAGLVADIIAFLDDHIESREFIEDDFRKPLKKLLNSITKDAGNIPAAVRAIETQHLERCGLRGDPLRQKMTILHLIHQRFLKSPKEWIENLLEMMNNFLSSMGAAADATASADGFKDPTSFDPSGGLIIHAIQELKDAFKSALKIGAQPH